ncbi:MAG: PhnD/SsuA/transferrin family substrate-binding protein [Pseudomonadota bacterium]
MIASLGMYDMPHLRGAHDRLWAGVRDALGYGPEHLTRDGDTWTEWQSPDLLLAQTCGLPYRARLHGKVTLVGTPDYDLPDCPPGHYFSYLVRRSEDARPLKTLVKEGVTAFNDRLSQSGWAALVDHLNSHMPTRTTQTFGHVASIDAVRNHEADVAAIDALTYILWAGAHPLPSVEIDAFDRTRPTPALPYITARNRDPEPLAHALETAIADLSDADRRLLRLNGLVYIPASEYLSIPIPPAP